MVRADQGDFDEAVALYGRALRQDPALARVHFDLAQLLHEQTGDYVAAIYHYRQYLELRPASDKRELIEARIKAAREAFVGKEMVKSDAAPVEEGPSPEVKKLALENSRLRERIGDLEAALAARTQPEPPRKYIVKRGDTLNSIAGRVYQDPEQWRKIYMANRDSLSGPNRLTVGQELVVP